MASYAHVSVDIVTLGKYLQHASNFAYGRHKYLPPDYARFLTTSRTQTKPEFALFAGSTWDGIVVKPLSFTSSYLKDGAKANPLYAKCMPKLGIGTMVWTLDFRMHGEICNQLVPEFQEFGLRSPYPPR
jgi:hypothetical protein